MLALSACGDSHTKVTTGTYAGESGANAPYLNVGPLIYEVQLSRQLNPFNIEDAGYLRGSARPKRKLEPGRGVVRRVHAGLQQHRTSRTPASTDLTISDTQGNIYTPIPTSATNLFAYRGGLVPAKSQLPAPGTTAYFGPHQGSCCSTRSRSPRSTTARSRSRSSIRKNPTDNASAELDV